ncbi:acetyl-CoA hydrolase [Piromyces finnis]|uniref:Acetyl-CoA hydrolase n=1 Tax=Piromyces finnis TaxID=1754191 RepID=A0A1Y1UVT9_9FUNG|nr:acetyl-CoA hydrolase [Piromyces finnis]|eukprot:ORX41724.1 acetyl-CoA hydrolase [Piromyces finnis]
MQALLNQSNGLLKKTASIGCQRGLASMSEAIKERIRCPSMLKKVTNNPEDVTKHLFDDMRMGWSGFTGVGYPKVVPEMMAQHVEKNNLKGKFGIHLVIGASAGAAVHNRLAKLDMLKFQAPFQNAKDVKTCINTGKTNFADTHLSKFPVDLLYGYYALDKKVDPEFPLDVGVLEASAITEDGLVIPTASVGTSNIIGQVSKKIIIEINTAEPSFEGMHDIETENPPNCGPLMIKSVGDRIGTKGMKIDPSRIVAIVESTTPDKTPNNTKPDAKSQAIANHIVDFFNQEVKAGRMPKSLYPLQSGIGNVANAVVSGLVDSPYENVTVFTEVLQDCFLDFFDKGKLDHASATSIRLSPDGFKRFYANKDKYAPRITLRSQHISNSPELIRRLGVIAMNTPVEFDIYGHVNSTCVMGTRMINGIGGSGDFLRNAKYSIIHGPACRKSKNDKFGITTVVPMVTHCDHPEHDLDVLVTDEGLADIRGLAPRQRVDRIIDNCAHPVYRPILHEYYDLAYDECLKRKAAHEPQLLDKAFKMTLNLQKNGTMRIDNWN